MTLPLFDPTPLQQGKPPKLLRPYQSRAIVEVRAQVLMGVLRILCVAPVGAGKTVVIANIVKSATLPVLVVAHRRELIDQAVRQLAAQGITHVGVIRGDDDRCDPSASVQVGSIATLARRDKPFAGQKVIVIIDECFPAGTTVDGRSIESISAGDWVSSFVPETGERVSKRVVRTFKRAPSSLVRLHCGDHVLTCTPNHKVWTRDGWCEAGRASGMEVMLEVTDEVFLRRMRSGRKEGETLSDGGTPMRAVPPGEARESREEGGAAVRCLREDDPLPRQRPSEATRAVRPRVLLRGAQETVPERLIGKDAGRLRPQARLSENAKAQSDAPSRVSGEDETNAPQDGPCPETQGREREGAYSAGEATVGSARLVDQRGRASGAGAGQRVPHPLQAGRGERGVDGGDRGRRGQPLLYRTETSRSAERGEVAYARVDSVEVLESGRDGTFGGVCPDGHVYNLEVEETHTYFANGIAVSNCHRAASDSYQELLSHYPDAIVLGFTATPIRLDGRPLGGDLFQHLVQVATYAELLKRPDWLVAPDVFSGSELPDVSRVRVAGSDFDDGQLAEVVRADRIEGDVVRTWLARAHLHPVSANGVRVPGKYTEGDRRRTLVFAVNVEHSLSLAERFGRAGVRAAHLDGSTPERERDAILRDLASGALEVVTNCQVAVEGIDIPEVKCVSFARPTQSVTVWRQGTGRLMRPWGDVTPLLLDHAGNFDRLGCPFEDVAWSLKERPKRVGGQGIMRKCPACGGYVTASRVVCPHCGAELPRAERELTESDQELRERATEPEALKWAYFWRQVVVARTKGFKPGFASALYKERYGSWPPRHWSDKIKAEFEVDGLWKDLLARRLERKAEREAAEAREEQALAEAAAQQERSEEEAMLERSIAAIEGDGAPDYAGEAPFADHEPGDSPFADWLEDEGIS